MDILINAKVKDEELEKFSNFNNGDILSIQLSTFNNDDIMRVNFCGAKDTSENEGADLAIRMIDAEIRDVIREHMLCYTPKDVIEILEFIKQQIKDNNGNKD